MVPHQPVNTFRKETILSGFMLSFRYFNGTASAREYLQKGNYTQFNLLLQDITDASHSPRNYFMEACKFIKNAMHSFKMIKTLLSLKKTWTH